MRWCCRVVRTVKEGHLIAELERQSSEDWKGLNELNTKVYLCIRGLIQFADECWREVRIRVDLE